VLVKRFDFTRRLTDERGFALATILVLGLVLTAALFYGASATRVDVQLANNEQNEKEAFYVAEAGVTEALVRLNLSSPTNAVVDGSTFDAALAGNYAPDASQPCWKAQVLFGASTTTKAGNTITTPTIQVASSRLDYSTSSGSTESLTVGWERSDGTLPTAACTGTETIRQIGGQNVLAIVSTGQSGTARRRIVQRMTATHTSTVVLRPDYCPGVYAHGNGQVSFPGSVPVNSTCAIAASTSGTASIRAAGPVTVSGSGYSGNVSPTPSTNKAQQPDPLAAIPEPPVSSLPKITSLTNPLTPGRYVGGLSLQSNRTYIFAPGIYVMQGGGLHIPSNTVVTSSQTGGVLIYNTCAAPPCSASSFGSNDTIDIKSTNITLYGRDQSDTTYAGLVIYQDRVSTGAISIDANASGKIDGLIYARDGKISMQGGSDLLHSQLVVGGVDIGGNPTIGAPTIWVPLGGSSGVQAMSWQDF